MRRIIFLDIDGVLNSQNFIKADPENWSHGWSDDKEAWRHMDPAAVALLEKVIQASGAKIVVSSTWRKTHSVEQLQGYLHHHGCTGEVIGLTPVLWRDDESGRRLYRGDEIKDWLDGIYETTPNGYDDVESFVILDDGSDMEPLSDWLVQTDYKTGLTQEHVDAAIKMLVSK